MAYTAIADSELDADSELITSLATKLRDNIDALYEDTRLYALKTVDEEITNDQVLSDDADLGVTLGADEVWEYKFVLYIRTTLAADFKYQIVAPELGIEYYASFAWRSAVPENMVRGATGVTDAVIYTGVPAYANSPIIIHGIMRVDGVGGAFKLRWAQATAVNPDVTGVGAGSYLVMHRLDDL